MAITTYHSRGQPDTICKKFTQILKAKEYIRFREMNNVCAAAHTSYIDNILDQLMEFTESLSASQGKIAFSLRLYRAINFSKRTSTSIILGSATTQYSYVSRCNTNVSQSWCHPCYGIRTNFCIK